MKPYRLNPDEQSTVRIALASWAEQCKREAATMDAWAVDDSFTDPETRAKCRANADASRGLQLEAEVLLRRIRMGGVV